MRRRSAWETQTDGADLSVLEPQRHACHNWTRVVCAAPPRAGRAGVGVLACDVKAAVSAGRQETG